MKFNLKYLFVLIFVITYSGHLLPQILSGTEVKKTFYPNGTIKTEGEYWYDRLHGFYREYYSTGQLWKEWKFEDGKENFHVNKKTVRFIMGEFFRYFTKED